MKNFPFTKRIKSGSKKGTHKWEELRIRCTNCGNIFKTRNPDREFCNDNCRFSHHNKVRRLERKIHNAANKEMSSMQKTIQDS